MSAPPLAAVDTASRDEPELLPELDVFIDNAMHRYPEAALFLDERTRPWIMGTGGALLLLALGLLGISSGRPRS